ncbi:MAG: coenzyme F420-0:L-glutamate ligase [Opitutales bacterium]|nr:coenzyme F420-0:L-glutamate ligase [Opitutales bacterium]
MVEFFTIKTRVLVPPKDDLFSVLDESVSGLTDGDILLIASKVLAIHQGRCIKKGEVDKLNIIQQEADVVFGPVADPCVTIKDRAFVPNSGVDESNGCGYYILWPRDVGDLLSEIHSFLCKKNRIKNLGILSVDSRVLPMRTGTVGISQASFGFVPVSSCIGEKDLFGRPMRISQVNIADCLAGISPLLMGEGSESCPFIVARGVAGVQFYLKAGDLSISSEQDLFSQFLENKKAPTSGA